MERSFRYPDPLIATVGAHLIDFRPAKETRVAFVDLQFTFATGLPLQVPVANRSTSIAPLSNRLYAARYSRSLRYDIRVVGPVVRVHSEKNQDNGPDSGDRDPKRVGVHYTASLDD
jgi:hypothetical protein